MLTACEGGQLALREGWGGRTGLVVPFECRTKEDAPALDGDVAVPTEDMLVVPPLMRQFLVPQQPLPPSLQRSMIHPTRLVKRRMRELRRLLPKMGDSRMERIGRLSSESTEGESRRREGEGEAFRLGGEVVAQGVEGERRSREGEGRHRGDCRGGKVREKLLQAAEL